jgi:hypothetical protein
VHAQACTPVPSGLVSWWPADGDATDVLHDNDGTLENGAGFTPGLVGPAFSFDGGDDHVRVPDSATLDFGTGDFTVAFWVRFGELRIDNTGMVSKDSFGLGDVKGLVFNMCTLCGTAGGFGTGSSGIGFETRNWTGAGPWTHARYATSNFTTGEWYHLAGVRQANVLYLYVNGVLRATTPEPVPADLDNEAPLMVGGLSPGIQFMNGSIDELAVFGRALEASEVQAIVLAGSAGMCKTSGPQLTSLTLKKPIVAGCKPMTGTVTLSGPAPAGGAVVTLSETLASGSVPASVTIPAGATSKTFKVTTAARSDPETGTVSATYGGTTLTKPLTIRPMSVLSIPITPTTLVGGGVSSGVVKLECKAGPGPILVEFGSTLPAVASTTVPNVLIPVGVQTAPVTVTTSPVAKTTKPKITATANGLTKSKTLTVTP